MGLSYDICRDKPEYLIALDMGIKGAKELVSTDNIF